MPRLKDLTGQKFNRLLVLHRDEQTNRKGVYWICQCDCGNLKIVSSSHLISGHTKSCGCYQSELARERADVIRKYGDTPNKYELVSAWCFNEETMSWGQGHYFTLWGINITEESKAELMEKAMKHFKENYL